MDSDKEIESEAEATKEFRQSTAGFNLIFLHSSVDDAGLDPHTFRVLAHLSRRAGGPAGKAFGSIRNIASVCKMDRKTVLKAIETLQVTGFIRKVERPGKPSIIRILPPQPAVEPKKEPKPRKVKGDTDPRVKEFLDRWCLAYEQTFGDHYVVQWGADGAAVKRLLSASDLDPTRLVALAVDAWDAQEGKDAFTMKFANSIRGFVSHFNEIRRTLAGKAGRKVQRPTSEGSDPATFGIDTGANLT